MSFSDLEIHFLFFKNEFREGTYPPQGGTENSTPLWGVSALNPSFFPGKQENISLLWNEIRAFPARHLSSQRVSYHRLTAKLFVDQKPKTMINKMVCCEKMISKSAFAYRNVGLGGCI